MSTHFPIKTSTACQLKWVWSTLYLNGGKTASCHRTSFSKLTADNFSNFHNTETKIQDRQDMLQGAWPEKNCLYCKSVEHAGGVSDRIRHQLIPYAMPVELQQDHAAIEVSPTMLEVYFNNTCNLGCLYCSPELSSFIQAENRKHNDFEQGAVSLKNTNSDFANLVPHFWTWFSEHFPTISRFHVLGGEPFYQKDFDKLLDMIDQHPNANCVLNVVTNLSVPQEKLQTIVEKLKALLMARKLKRVDITCSIDCWGQQQEYVRWPLDLKQWENNLNYLLLQKYLYLNINQTISVLTIKTMPALLEKLAIWRKIHKIGHWFSEVSPGPEYMKPGILGGKIFEKDFEKILALMPQDTDDNRGAYNYMQGIARHITSQESCSDKIQDLMVYLAEKDRRRGTDWKTLFPWLIEMQSHVV